MEKIVSVKWQKELFSNVEIDTTQSPYVFKCQLYDLTGVPPERQKIMDDADWSKVGVKEGQKLMMMGTADEIVKAPEKALFLQKTCQKKNKWLLLNGEYVKGVQGTFCWFNKSRNTCYMNSTVQCLHSVPELKSALIKYPPPVRSSSVDQSSHSLTVATRELFGELDKNALRSKYPQFAQLHNGIYMQQDAEECWTQLLFTLSLSLKAPSSSEDADTVKRLFGIDLVSSCLAIMLSIISCQIVEIFLVLIRKWQFWSTVLKAVKKVQKLSQFYSLKCHISQEVNHLHEGLRRGLKSELEKSSPSLGRSAIYTKDSRINDLPRYLTIQFVRFFWKRETNQKAKILRKVDYPLELDVYDLCSDDLRKRLTTGTRFSACFLNIVGPSNGSGNSSKSASGEGYSLTTGKWIQFDDDNPIPQREEDITRLSGGGDWHMAYICMYKARDVSM
ncbi:UNVERIFIED_CONTAM: Ubiquitin carboxyl-terminal hydrolase 6 [Sesamum calycinum]|uniref:ubiquitinyl hydrolase 1 n=1 Tax=Sesamum calycinum TaxID=2727403 RepID=A0AAW2NEC5_9LAMI